jgi:hypothetical protein
VTRRLPLLPVAVGPLLVAVTTAMAVAVTACGNDSPDTRQEAVAERGREVMPFDLEATTHRFTSVADGLVQTVVADNPNDETQVDLVRSHLRAEASRFERGDFDDPARIHGEKMPGLARIRNHAGRIAVTYRSITGGGEISYRTADPDLVDALHGWADAQTSDHGDHATY